MSSRPLFIRLEQMKEILIAIDRAKSRPVPRAVFDAVAKTVPQDGAKLKFRDRRGYNEHIHDRYPPQYLIIEVGFHCMFSFEEQPIGLCRHLSIAVEDDGMKPERKAAEIIALAFGIDRKKNRCWTEEYEPGKFAVNYVSLDRPGQRP